MWPRPVLHGAPVTPAARIEAAIDLLGRIEAAPQPADRTMSEILRRRRYMGAKDRRAVTDLVYGVLRRRARLDWWLSKAASGFADGRSGPRHSVIAALVLGEAKVEGMGAEEIATLFDGNGYHPAPLTGPEQDMVAALAGKRLAHPGQPLWVRGEFPKWLLADLTQAFGAALEGELAAFAAEAPLDLRVNGLKGDRAAAISALAEEGFDAAPTRWSPWGLRIAGRRAILHSRAFTDGLVEVQDQGSQLVALVCDARPDMAVADLCAGAGGKTLALAAAMANRGRLVALDNNQKRLDRSAARLRRAGAGIVERRGLPDESWRAESAGAFDRVLVDAPCSGSGAWRRQPDARWRLSPEDLAGYRATQAELLALAAPLVNKGGRLIYATCSVLPAENQDRIAAFLAARPDFAPLSAAEIWAETTAGDPPATAFMGPYLSLSPARHGTDGFFAAVLRRGDPA